MAFTAADRRIGGLISAARGDMSARGRKSAAARRAAFVAQVDPAITDPQERERRATLLERAHMARIASKRRKA